MGWSWAGALSGIDKIQAKRLKEKELEDEREKSLLGLYLAKLEKQATTRTSDKYTTAAQSAMKLQKRVSGADLSEEDVAFFNNIIDDPFAAEEVLNFLDTNVSVTGTPIPLSDVRSMMNIVQSNIPEEEKIDYMSLITGADLSDKSKYYELATQLTNITTTPGRTILTDVKPEARIIPKTQEELFERQLGIVSGNLLRNAKQFVKDQNYDTNNQQVVKIQNAIDMINSGNKDSIQVGREILMEEYLTPENFKQDFLENHPDAFRGWEKNYYLPPSLKAGSEPIETPILPPKAISVPEAAIDDLIQNRNNQQVIKDFNDAFGHLGTSAEEYIRQRTRER
jgi:hypothetical protein